MANQEKNGTIKNYKEMPHNLEAEQSLLGCLLLDSEIQLELLATLTEDHFYSESHKYIINAMREIYEQKKAVDLVTLTDQLERNTTLEAVGGISYLTELTRIVPSTANYKYYCEIVQRDGLLRRLIRSATAIVSEAQSSQDGESALAFAEKTIFDLSTTQDTSSVVEINEVIPEVLGKFDQINKDKDAFRGMKTGFTKLDYLTNGLHPTDLVLIAARPATGKTSFAMNIVENVATKLTGKVCMVFSLEMGKEQLVQRMLCSVAEVSMEKALKGDLGEDGWIKLGKAKNSLQKAKIFIDDSSLITPPEMLSKCRRVKRKYGLDLIMVDYIQLMTSGSKRSAESRQVEITEISRSLKILAKEINVPVIALSQLSRAVESRTGHRPQLSDLRESGAIEQDADIVMFIHRPDNFATEKEILEEKVQKNVAEIIIAKHRNGPTGVVKLYFRGECTKFVNLVENEPEEPVYNRDEIQGIEDVPVPDDEDAPVPEEAPPLSPDEDIWG